MKAYARFSRYRRALLAIVDADLTPRLNDCTGVASSALEDTEEDFSAEIRRLEEQKRPAQESAGCAMIERRYFELFREGEHAGTFDLYEDAHREAYCSNRPWEIWACRGIRASVVARGDGEWKATHTIALTITKTPHLDRPVCIGWTLINVMATPEGLCFTEGAWNRGGPPDFRNTAGGLKRGDGRPLSAEDITITPLGA